MEDTSEIKDLCAKFDRWNEDYERFEVENDQWIQMKNQLENRMNSTEQNIDAKEIELCNIEQNIICLNRMVDTDEKNERAQENDH